MSFDIHPPAELTNEYISRLDSLPNLLASDQLESCRVYKAQWRGHHFEPAMQFGPETDTDYDNESQHNPANEWLERIKTLMRDTLPIGWTNGAKVFQLGPGDDFNQSPEPIDIILPANWRKERELVLKVNDTWYAVLIPIAPRAGPGRWPNGRIPNPVTGTDRLVVDLRDRRCGRCGWYINVPADCRTVISLNPAGEPETVSLLCPAC